MPTERIEFKGHSGDMLAARLDLPDGPVRTSAVFAHCFTCSKDLHAARRIAGRLAAQGIAVLRFDFTGLGHSGGEFANTHFSSNVADLVCAADYLAERGMAPQLLVGHSLGGSAVIAAASRIKGLRAVATIGAPFDPSHVSNNFGAKLDEIAERGAATVTLSGREFTIRKAFLDDIAGTALGPSLAHLGAALLVMHAPRDETVGIDNASEIFRAARHPKSFVTLDGADHLITREKDAIYAADIIATWSARYVEPRPLPEAAEVPEGVVRVSEHDPGGFRQDVALGPRHRMLADEPVAAGGTDTGPNPYEFLSAGLGACTAMTIRLYARRKGIPLTHVSVDVSHDRDHVKDCEDCEESKTMVDVFTRVVEVQGELTGEQRASLLRIADMCPVHRTLKAASVIRTELKS
ncbi:bifunctional alpha/beta hydrolase/OsmC family protein [Frigidibacter sp. ROC022]|uniref:bifunctional alpha/beta hydrolase/OsmC family protein n=1 Tax=Frigidibacter sp. ROC022 TaxID=2971796 RepID=UPI00215B3103|nr:bifunctional alpha/beta hydrolase/OsmC family protein [Frigidibacter sp. ROC022]MCR8725528.1 alpha/beta fold hydrolase [Frigidibacter sp. ROC022]